jgi:monoamine oxidase
MIETLFGLFGSSDLSTVSWVYLMRWYALSGYNMVLMNDITARYKIKGGTGNLIDRIAKDSKADIRLGTAVSSVEQSGEKVTITTEAGDKLTCRAAICTIPLNVLQDVKFSPSLDSQKLAVSKEGHTGGGTKLHIKLDKEYPNFSAWAPGGDVPLNCALWDSAAHGKTHVIAFGPSPETLDVNDTPAVEAAMQKFLPDAKVTANYGYDWNLDPYSKGVWYVARPGQGQYIEDLQKPQGRVHFSSADWANGWSGTIDGAIEQGLANANSVNELLAET